MLAFRSAQYTASQDACRILLTMKSRAGLTDAYVLSNVISINWLSFVSKTAKLCCSISPWQWVSLHQQAPAEDRARLLTKYFFTCYRIYNLLIESFWGRWQQASLLASSFLLQNVPLACNWICCTAYCGEDSIWFTFVRRSKRFLGTFVSGPKLL